MRKDGIKASVIVPVYNEEFFIKNFLESLKNQDVSKEDIEIILVDGYSSDNTLNKIEKFRRNNQSLLIKVLNNKKRTPASSLNKALENSKGDFIIRLDVHSEIPNNYLRKIIRMLEEHEEVCNLGGRTVAKGYDKISSIVAKVTSHPMVIGSAQFRYAKKKMKVDTVFPGAWRREDLISVGGWNEEWVVNEDAELNIRLRNRTKKDILLFPDISIYYHPRNTIKSLMHQYFRYGYWRMKTANRHPENIRTANALPVFIIIVCSILLITTLFLGVSRYFITLLLLTYISFLIIIYRKSFKAESFFLTCILIFVIQSSWSFGNVVGHFVFGFPLRGYLNVTKRLIK